MLWKKHSLRDKLQILRHWMSWNDTHPSVFWSKQDNFKIVHQKFSTNFLQQSSKVMHACCSLACEPGFVEDTHPAYSSNLLSVMSSWYHQPQLRDKDWWNCEKTIVITSNITIHFLRWQILRRHRHCKSPPIPALSLVLTLYEFCSMKKYVKIDSESALFTRYQAFDIARFWQGLRK